MLGPVGPHISCNPCQICCLYQQRVPLPGKYSQSSSSSEGNRAAEDRRKNHQQNNPSHAEPEERHKRIFLWAAGINPIFGWACHESFLPDRDKCKKGAQRVSGWNWLSGWILLLWKWIFQYLQIYYDILFIRIGALNGYL